MDTVAKADRTGSRKKGLVSSVLIVILVSAVWNPQGSIETALFVANGLIDVSPLVLPGILLTAWINASGAGSRIANVFNGQITRTIIIASLVGAITPVCGVTVLPLMVGLLVSGVPFAPVMAFWLSSPVTDPGMLATTAATLGYGFAIGKTIAAFGLGLLGGLVTAFIAGCSWALNPLRENNLVGSMGNTCCSGPVDFIIAPWSDHERRQQFLQKLWTTARLILICLIPAFVAEHLLNAFLKPDALTEYVGTDAWWAIPFAVVVGAPAYLDGYAALPLTRGLIDHGMSIGAAMAFLVSGGVVSIWGAMAIFPVLRTKPFLLYLGLAITGSMASGWIFEATMSFLNVS